MNKYYKAAGILIGIEILWILVLNGLYLASGQGMEGRLYRVEAARVTRQLEELKSAESDAQPVDLAKLDLSQYQTIVGVREFQPEQESNHDYIVKQAGDTLYCIEYVPQESRSGLIYINLASGVMLLVTLFLLGYLDKKVIKPFYHIRELPGELAKGNLSMPVKEEKSRFFGRFLWGMDMLRETLEANKEKELELHKEKKTLLLSLTHDIKTPLSAIKLYTKAVSENLYDTEEKRQEALLGIQKNVTEIENYINEINKTAREDFLNLEVEPGEFYLSEVLEAVGSYYQEKLALVHTEFIMLPQQDCLLKGDKNRIVEVLQNIMENAMKYGDGRVISISGENEEDCRLLTITNSGCSLKEEELPNLFDSFYRGSNSQGIRGSGLGLYICKKLMQQMDGEVFAKLEQDKFHVTVVIRRA